MLAITARELASAVAGQLIVGNPDIVTTNIATDTRDVTGGSTFVAMVGERVDGHRFAAQAPALGATILLISDVSVADELRSAIDVERVAVVLVHDGLSAIQSLAHYQRAQLAARVVGVTGSTGKTSTKSFLASVLGERFRVVATEGNQNNELGCPLTILRADESTEVLVVEMGMRAPGEIAELAALSRPEIGVVTNIGPVHLETLGSMDAIVDAKGELLQALPADGLAVIEAGTHYGRRLALRSAAAVVEVGLGHASGAPGVYSTAVTTGDDGRVSATIHSADEQFKPFGVTIPLPGVHHLSNALFAIAVGAHLGMTAEELTRGVNGATIPGMRWAQIDDLVPSVTIINDAYNANPTSVAAAVRTFSTVSPEGRHVAVLGDMLELGAASEDEHARIGEICAESGIDIVFGFGPSSRATVVAAARAGVAVTRHFDGGDIAIMVRTLAQTLAPGDIVLLKGSRGMALERVIDLLADEVLTGTAMGAPDVR